MPEGKPSGSREEKWRTTSLGEEGLPAPEKEVIHLVWGHLKVGRRRLFARKPLIASLPALEFRRVLFSKGLEGREAGRFYNIPETSIRTA